MSDILKPIHDRIIDAVNVPPPPDKLPYLFGPYLMKGSVHLLTGQTGSGKTTLGMNIVTSLATGQDIWGIPCEPCRVLYIDMESGDTGRSIKLRRLYPDGFPIEQQLFFLPPPISLPEQKDELVELAIRLQVDLVVFDTARRCFGVQDENSNAEVYNRVIPTPDALKSAGIASLIVCHPSKNGGAGARGAGAQEDAGDVNLTLTLPNGSGKDATVALSVTKHRLLGFEVEPLLLKRIGGDRFERVGSVESDVENTPEARTKQQECQYSITDYLSEHKAEPVSYTTITNALSAMGYSQTMTQSRLKALVEDGEVLKDKKGYRLCDPFADE